jgi:hypothetical protein
MEELVGKKLGKPMEKKHIILKFGDDLKGAMVGQNQQRKKNT